jgi:hypothetical protein
VPKADEGAVLAVPSPASIFGCGYAALCLGGSKDSRPRPTGHRVTLASLGIESALGPGGRIISIVIGTLFHDFSVAENDDTRSRLPRDLASTSARA